MKIFFLGGTFDPPHLGHLAIAKKCLKHCDHFIFIPSKQNPIKKNPYFACSDRVDMLNLMISDMKASISIDLFEIESNVKVNYSIDTIKYLIEKYNPSRLCMVIGQDLLENIKNWKDWDKVKEMVEIVCVNRPGYDDVSDTDVSFKIDDIILDIDSTSIRKNIKSNNLSSLHDLLDVGVFNYIKDKIAC